MAAAFFPPFIITIIIFDSSCPLFPAIIVRKASVPPFVILHTFPHSCSFPVAATTFPLCIGICVCVRGANTSFRLGLSLSLLFFSTLKKKRERIAAFCVPSSLLSLSLLHSSVNERHSFATRHCVFSGGASNCHLGAGEARGSTPLELLPSQPACTFFNNFPPKALPSFSSPSSLPPLFSPRSHSLPPSVLLCFFFFNDCSFHG